VSDTISKKIKLEIDSEQLEHKLTEIENQLDRILTKLERVKNFS